MLHQLRWQIALAAVGVAAIAVVVVLFSHRGFTDVPSRGGQMVEAVVGKPVVLNPLFAVDDAEQDAVSLIFGGLTRPDPALHVVPDLATRWVVSPDGLAYTFEIRSGAVFHDGHPVTADDVLFTARLAAAIANDSALAVAAAPVVRLWERVTAEKAGEQTVVLRLPEPYGPFIDATTLGILPQHLIEDVDKADLANHRFSRLEPVGCGPYRVEPGSFDGSSIRLLRFDQHWSATDSKPYLDGLVLQFHPSVRDAVAVLGKQDVQAMGGVPAAVIADLGETAREYAAVQPGFGLVYLNNDNVLFSEQAVRSALSLAVDRNGIASAPELLGGQGQASANPIPSGSWAYAPQYDEVATDRAAAARALDDAGWIDSDRDGVRDRDGRPLRFRLGVGADPGMAAIGRKVASDWKQLGADPEIETLDQAATVQALTSRQYDAMLFSWELPQYDPDPYPLWHSSQAQSGQNYAAFRNEAADAAMVEARRLPATMDNLDERTALYATFQRIFAQEVPSIVLYHPVFSYVIVDPNLGGVQVPPLTVRNSDRFLTLSDWFVHTSRVFRDEGAEP